jgi:hypothetical protein
MTKENSKRLYDHYVADGNDNAAANMVAKYPEFAKKAEKPKEEKKEQKQKVVKE